MKCLLVGKQDKPSNHRLKKQSNITCATPLLQADVFKRAPTFEKWPHPPSVGLHLYSIIVFTQKIYGAKPLYYYSMYNFFNLLLKELVDSQYHKCIIQRL